MKRISYTLPVLILKEDDAFIAYTPALDLSTMGDTYSEALKNFQEASSLFFEEIMNNGTLEEVLIECGWKKTGKTLAPPIQISSEVINITIPHKI